MSILLRIGAVRGNSYSIDHLSSGQDAASSDTDAHDIPVPEETYQRPTQTYPGCFGLPYQDHNYGAPPPLSPTPPKTPPPPVAPKVNGAVQLEEEAKVPAVSNEEEVVEDSVTRCICGYLHDDGYMICCDKCSVWQHIDCMEIDRNNIPENYCCEICEPRKLDVDRAKMIQQRKREEIASLGRKPVQPKPKGSKQRRVSKVGSRLLKVSKLAKSQQLKRDKKLKLTKKEKENVKDISKKLKIGKTGIPKQKKMKKKLNTSLAQNKAEFWSSVSGPFCSVDEARENECSPEILEFLSHVKTNGIHSPHSIGVFPEELLVRLYQVSDVKKNCKGLEATDLIVPGRAVIEFKGKVMLRQHYHHDPLLDQSQPYVLYYSKFEGLDLCIDASAFGGDARFIRRSCTPNAEMCHIIDNGNLHFIVQAKKEIAKGSEITIPFDFNYQDTATSVECACGKVSCPVAKFWKKIKLAQKSPDKPKRKRQASGEGRVRRNSQSKSSPMKTASGSKSPVKSSPVKSPASVTPLSFTMDECSVSVDSTASLDSPPPVCQPAKTSSIPRRSSRAASDAKEERDVKPSRTSVNKEPVAKSAPVQEDIQVIDVQSSDPSAAGHASESEAESAGECPKKKQTREEKKIEAIMKAFEKMAKREERRKEALARLDKKHDGKDEPGEKTQAAETSDGNLSETATDKANELPPPPPDVNSHHLETEIKVTIKLEDPPPIIESPQKTARNKRVKRKRRSSRVMSAIEPLYRSPVRMLPEPVPVVAVGVEVKEEPVEPPIPVACHSAPNTASPDFDAATPDFCDSYMFIKKKKYLVNDWGAARAADARSDSMDEHGEEEMFVPYTPGPRSAMEHMTRRNSTSATFGRSQDIAGGNAKKRWLRQAMHETGPIRVDTSPSTTGSNSQTHPNTSAPTSTPAATATATTPSLPSPTSPSDFVTPLKKRRLAPEFLPSTSSAADPAASSTSEPSATVTNNCEVSGTYPTTSTPASAVETVPASQDRSIRLKLTETRLPMKATRLFGRRNRNGFVGSTDSKPAACDGPVPGSSSASVVRPTVEVPPSDSRLEELSMDGLSSSSSVRTATSSATLRSSVDVAEVSGCSADSPGAPASSSSVMCVVNNNDSGIEMPLVDSSGAALDADLPETGHQRVRGIDSVSVCSSDNEVSISVHSADSDQRSDRGSAPDLGVVAESSSVSNAVGISSPQDQDQDVSESRPAELEMEDEGNEASGSVSDSEEPVGASDSRSHTSSQPAGDCQVNSSQDSPRLPPPACSPFLREAECNNSPEPLHPINRACDSWQVSPGGVERGAVSSALDSAVRDRDRTGVSSAQDSADVSSVLAMRDSDSLPSSDLECGPSSSTQTLGSRRFVSEDMVCNSSSTRSLHGRRVESEDMVCNSSSSGSLPSRRQAEMAEDMVCNSSEVTGSDVVPRVCAENNVDSTTQSGRRLRPSPNQCDTVADSCEQPVESEESCCDSNSDEQAYPAFVSGGGVSSSGPADSQCDQTPDTGHRGGAGPSNGVVSSSATVSSSQFRASHTDSCVSSIAAIASSSVLSTTEPGVDVAGPSQSTPGTSPSVSNSGVDSGSLDPSAQLVTSAGAMAMGEEGRETDSVGTSEQSSSSTSLAAEPCEASALLAERWRLSGDSDPSLQPGTSGLPQCQEEGEVSMSSAAAAGLDGEDDGVVVNGDVTPGGLVSSYSEDSSGSNSTNTINSSCTAVSSSEAQAAPAAKRKVSLSEYRSRRKDKGGCAASTSSSTSPKSSGHNLSASRRATVDSSISLAPLPLFEPITISRENRDFKEQERERREKPMSLSDRLRIEFGLETASEEDKANSSGHRKPPNDIPPPPPLPPNGVLGVVGVRRAIGKGSRAENDEDSRQGSGSSLTGRSPSATTTMLGAGAATAAFPSPSGNANHTLGSQPAGGQSSSLQPGYTWLAKLHSGRQTSTALPHQQPPPPPPPSSSSPLVIFGQHQAQLPSFNGSGAAVPPHLPNGSHPQPPAPAAFSPGAMYPSPPSGQPQPFTATPPPPALQQQAPPPPPPPSTAYSSFVAQSRTHPPQTSPQQIPRVRSGSLSQAQRSGSVVGNGSSGRVRHASAEPSSHHPTRRHHFDQYSHTQTAKHKGSFGPAMKRH
ncbi:inactive histone-lysine N-methyltransferase 2E-like isoform X2 [Littorina saxatilis]|uniref:SET domain-containing protein n=1 Tax=Littorina saxatilis TaxID=31220 RepID=A0AAN9GCN8_9CAEN